MLDIYIKMEKTFPEIKTKQNGGKTEETRARRVWQPGGDGRGGGNR
jgi:hypothetical protein